MRLHMSNPTLSRQPDKCFHQRQGGFIELSTIFMLIVLAIGIGYAIHNGLRMMGSSDVSHAQDNIGQLIANTRKLKGLTGYGTAGTNLVPELQSIKGLPKMGLSGSTLYNVWNGTVTVVSNGMSFVITSSGMPQEGCVLLSTDISLSGRVTTSINGGSSVTGEVTKATASSSCSDSNNNSVSWTSY